MDYKTISKELHALQVRLAKLERVMQIPSDSLEKELRVEEIVIEEFSKAVDRITALQKAADEKHRMSTLLYRRVASFHRDKL